MGLSVAIAGAIVLSVLMVVLMTMTGFVGTMFTIGDVTTQISQVEKSIAKTDISLDALEALSGSAKVNFTLNNDDTEKLWNFEHFNVLIEYDNAAGTVVEELSFNGDCSGIAPLAGNWCIESIGADILDEDIINDGESGDIWTQVSQNLVSANALVTVSTDNGVVAMLPAPKRSWIDAAPIPPITCEVGNYGRTFIDTDTGISYVCDPTRDKWLSFETMTLIGETEGDCDPGDNFDSDQDCHVDVGRTVGGDAANPDVGVYFPQNFTITAYSFSADFDECDTGSFDIEIWGSESNVVDEPMVPLADIATLLTGQAHNDNALNVDVEGNQYALWGMDNNCAGSSTGYDDFNIIIYFKWRHDQP